MSLKLKIELLSALRERYYRSTKKQKGVILDELCAVTGFSRKYAIRILAKKHLERPKRSGRGRVYSMKAKRHLEKLWVLMGQLCSKKMVSALPTWLEFYEDRDCSMSVREELLSMSASTIDRYLKNYKATYFRRKRSGTKPGKMLKHIIPLKDLGQVPDTPGHVEADTVAHCGNTLSGTHIWSLTFTDIYSGWTDNRAIFGKGADPTLSAIMHIRRRLPFELQSFNTDNGSEFLNRNLVMYFHKDKSVRFTRSRAYKKNDNCHVEQKNWTHVRDLFGYERYDHEDLVELMNDIYMHYQNVLHNFFIPQLKLVEKYRVGARYVRKYDKPQTPYQRLLNSPALSMGQKEELRRTYEDLNPIRLKYELEMKMRLFKRKVKQYKSEFVEEMKKVA